jgi:hypothetical protein
MTIDLATLSGAYAALLKADHLALAKIVAHDALVAVPANEGSGVEHLSGLMTSANHRGLRTWSDASADVLTSEYHAVVLDRWLCDSAPVLDQHVTVLFADRRDDGRFGLVSIYGYDNDAVSKFFGA